MSDIDSTPVLPPRPPITPVLSPPAHCHSPVPPDIDTTTQQDEQCIIDTSIQTDSLLTHIKASKDNLFMIQYTPADTLRPRWFIVQLDNNKKEASSGSGSYFCNFLQRHPNDDGKADHLARWWPEWRKIHWNKDGTFEYGERILYSPRAKPDVKCFSKFSAYFNCWTLMYALLAHLTLQLQEEK